MGSLEGKVAIVTGAAGGIGTAVEADNTAGRAPGATHRGPTRKGRQQGRHGVRLLLLDPVPATVSAIVRSRSMM